MQSAQLIEHFRTTYDSMVVNDRSEVEHFGALSVEADAALNTAVVCLLSKFIRIRATGADRAKFLHNFCTNNINQLPDREGCEAFFTDVKAKVLAHGWVLASEDCHELWMLPGDEQAILKHLNRYIITEDVTIESAPAGWEAFALLGPNTDSVLESIGLVDEDIVGGSWYRADGYSIFRTEWNEASLAIVVTAESQSIEMWQKLIHGGATAAGSILFEHQRILEGFPLFGIDISSDNLAPEADRNNQAISYTKGCYLGQEPIARLDAMGHVNRQLYRATIESPEGSDTVKDTEAIPRITSLSNLADVSRPALLTLKVKDATASKHIPALAPDGQRVSLRLSDGDT